MKMLKILFYNFFICASMGYSAYSADWMTVDVLNPEEKDAAWIQSYYGGSGLGYTHWSMYIETGNSKCASHQCCSDRCKCANVIKMATHKIIGTIFIAKKASNFNGGKITDSVIDSVKSHESFHGFIFKEITERFNGIASSNSIRETKPRKTAATAESASNYMHNLYDANLRANLTKAHLALDILDRYEAARVENGEWIHFEDTAGRNVITNNIKSYNIEIDVPDDKGNADCQ